MVLRLKKGFYQLRIFGVGKTNFFPCLTPTKKKRFLFCGVRKSRLNKYFTVRLVSELLISSDEEVDYISFLLLSCMENSWNVFHYGKIGHDLADEPQVVEDLFIALVIAKIDNRLPGDTEALTWGTSDNPSR